MSDTPVTEDLDDVIARYATEPFDDSTPIAEAGLVSLSVFRIITDLVTDPRVEIDAGRLAGIRTVTDLKAWLWEITASPVLTAGDVL
jgi:hypothetical protein